MAAFFPNALFDAAPVILGQRLQPLSLLHSYLLKLLESPFSVGGNVGVQDIGLAVWVCSLSTRELLPRAAELLDSIGDDRSDARKDLVETFATWDMPVGAEALKAAIAAFSDYFTFYNQAPSFVPGHEDTMERGAPWQWAVVVLLMRHFQFSEPKAWRTPPHRALAYLATMQEASGRQIAPEGFDALMERLGAENDKRLRGETVDDPVPVAKFAPPGDKSDG